MKSFGISWYIRKSMQMWLRSLKAKAYEIKLDSSYAERRSLHHIRRKTHGI